MRVVDHMPELGACEGELVIDVQREPFWVAVIVGLTVGLIPDDGQIVLAVAVILEV